MSVGGFFRSLSAKVSQSLEEIKIKSSEATNDIARGMRGIRDTTKAGVEKIGEALQITDSDASLYTDVDETAGMGLAMHYSQALGAIKTNNRVLIQKGDKATEDLQRIQQKTTLQHESLNVLIKECENLPQLCASISSISTRCNALMEKLNAAEEMLGNVWEETVVAQVSVWKQEKEKDIQTYKQKRTDELKVIEDELAKSRDVKLQAKRSKAQSRAAEAELAAAVADSAMRDQLDASIKRSMDDYLIYGFSSNSGKPVPSNVSSREQDLAAVVLPSSENPELDDFLGQDATPISDAGKEEDDDAPIVKVDDTTIDGPEL